MPKAPVLNSPYILEKLLAHLSVSGPVKAKSLCEILKISQPAFSRLVLQASDSILRIGRGPQTFYARKKIVAWDKTEIPILCMGEKGDLTNHGRPVATLHPILPQGFYLESHVDTLTTRIYKNLPYFLEDLRPSGFLGRLVPHLDKTLGFPDDINRWTDDDCLNYFINCGWDLIGNYFVGEEKSYNKYLENRIKRLDIVSEKDRADHYSKVAKLVLSQGPPGSSAGGEQPKFLAICEKQAKLVPVLVKFSPPISDAISHRIADLLICEHIAHTVLEKHGHTSLKSYLVLGKERLFLEMERFDRNSLGGRLGIISLRALDLEFVGDLKTWSATAESLFKRKKIDESAYQKIIWLDVFGRLIGNTDRHHGNISFFCEGERITGLAPVYDMLPMMYAPQQNQLIPRIFDVAQPKPFEMIAWKSALVAAKDFWSQVQKHPEISREFKDLVSENEAKLSLMLE